MIFHDFPGPGIFKKKVQDFPGGMETLYKADGRFKHVTRAQTRNS